MVHSDHKEMTLLIHLVKTSVICFNDVKRYHAGTLSKGVAVIKTLGNHAQFIFKIRHSVFLFVYFLDVCSV